MSEAITVTAESPLLNERRIARGTTVYPSEQESLPGGSDPWVVLRSTPSVLTDRVNVGGNESGQPAAVGPGAASDQNTWALDGLVITNMSALGSSASSYDFDALEEVQATTGGADATLETPGVRVDLVTRRGTNEWRGSGHLLWSGDALEEAGDHGIADLRAGGGELGGPLRRDRLWIWGSLHRDETGRIALGGQRQESLAEGGSLKLNGRLASSNSATVFWQQGETSVSGLGASPERAPKTTWDRDGREEIWKLEDTHILSSNLYVSGQWGETDRMLGDVPLGGSAGEARIDPAGVARGAWFGFAEDGRMRIGEFASSFFWNTGQLSHELKAGLSWRGEDRRTLLTAPGRIEVAEETLYPGHARVVEVWRGGEVETETSAASAWVQDVVSVSHATFTLGLRFDEQDLGIPGGSSRNSRPRTLSPRLGVSYSLGPERKTLLKAAGKGDLDRRLPPDALPGRLQPVGRGHRPLARGRPGHEPGGPRE